ncbi:hypothetical protein MARINON1_50651 [Marinobacter salarius]|nr:hypothetical protein MBHK15_130958 [Marinobacter salarius]VXB52622.1 hypothetical protein MARINON1_50651 [Marinobacter salarius]
MDGEIRHNTLLSVNIERSFNYRPTVTVFERSLKLSLRGIKSPVVGRYPWPETLVTIDKSR